MMNTQLLSTAIVGAALLLSASVARADAYDDAVHVQIAKSVEYPKLAKMRQLEGKVTYEVKIDPAGAVQDVTIDTSSGAPSLDNAALDAVKKAAPFPAPSGGARALKGVLVFQLS